MSHNESVEFYTDGSYKKETNRASYAVVRADNFDIFENGRINGVQNNYRAELFGIVRALQNTKNGQKVTIYTDSQSSIDAITKFKKTKKMEERINFPEKDLLLTITTEMSRKVSSIVWVKGHSNNAGNNEADKRANEAISHNKFPKIYTARNDKWRLSHNESTPTGAIRIFVLDIIYEIDTSECKYKYNILLETYANTDRSVPNFGIQQFIFRARSNQLATNSKIHKWSNGMEQEPCPRCKTEYEDQLHVIVGCKDNSRRQETTANEVYSILTKKGKYHLDIVGFTNMPGLPYAMSAFGITLHDNTNESRQLEMYRESLGLITEERYKSLTNATNNAHKRVKRVMQVLLNHSYNLWTNRCMINAIAKSGTREPGCRDASSNKPD